MYIYIDSYSAVSNLPTATYIHSKLTHLKDIKLIAINIL